MSTTVSLRDGQILEGPQFNEPVRVVTIRPKGLGWSAGVVGVKSNMFRQVNLAPQDFVDAMLVAVPRRA